MRSLYDLMSNDPLVSRSRVEMTLTEEQYRNVLDGAAEIFREQALLQSGAVPVLTVNDPGVIKSRRVKFVDMGDADIDADGTGGNFDRLDQAFDDKTVLRVKKNWEVPLRELQAAERSGSILLGDYGRISGEKVAEKTNKLLTVGAGGAKGISTVSGIDTFAAPDTWDNEGAFWKTLIEARGRLRANKIPVDRLALIANPTDEQNGWQTFSNTATPQTDLAIQRALPGGVYSSVDLPAGKAYFYANIPTVVQAAVYEPLHVIPLPTLDENPRGRVRIGMALHFPRPLGIVEATSIA